MDVKTTYYEVSKSTETDNSLYPDLKEAGSLSSLLNSSLNQLSPQLTSNGLDEEFSEFPSYARVAQENRSSQVYIAAKERLFLFDFWSKGILMANGQSSNINDVAEAIHYWIFSKPNIIDLKREFNYISIDKSAEDFEKGLGVEVAWKNHMNYIGDQFPELVEFVKIAFNTPELRQLFPFTSLNRFCFSRCTGFPYTDDCPYVQPIDNGMYIVRGLKEGYSEPLNAQMAVKLIIDNLPTGCGPAVDGTAETIDLTIKDNSAGVKSRSVD
jgi:hypothetical protein